MSKNISIIITKEYSTFYEKLIHFKVDDYFIIPVKADWIQFYLISNNGENGENLDEIFEKIVKVLYCDDTIADVNSTQQKHPKPLFQNIENLENLMLIEILSVLKLKNFELYHKSENEQNYVYWEEFVDGVLEYYACEKFMNDETSIWNNGKFNIENYSNYENCKIKFYETKKIPD